MRTTICGSWRNQLKQIMACHGQQALRSAMSERQDRAHRNFRVGVNGKSENDARNYYIRKEDYYSGNFSAAFY